jgi:hypothetical protein
MTGGHTHGPLFPRTSFLPIGGGSSFNQSNHFVVDCFKLLDQCASWLVCHKFSFLIEILILLLAFCSLKIE